MFRSLFWLNELSKMISNLIKDKQIYMFKCVFSYIK